MVHDVLLRHRVLVALLIIALGIVLRCAVGLHPYSGQAKPPMFGDYEAQRHWMELTVALPPTKWYEQTADNDLQYWGLDYPPLTAYHSWLCGLVGNRIVPEAYAFGSSRGHESYNGKLFMRTTVLVADLLVYIPACFVVVAALTRSARYRNPGMTLASGCPVRTAALALFLVLHPGLLLVDHGHFQFNGVALGLALFAIACLSYQQYILSSVFFCLALNYKQMLLYYSPAFFFYLLAVRCAGATPLRRSVRVAALGCAVIGTFAILWSPWLLEGRTSTAQLIHRLFPFERGLFEDKVANFWCALSLVYKAHQRHSRGVLQLASAKLTLLAFLPCSIHLIRRPSVASFIYALTITALAFFQFSFQVHEKTILLCVVPATLLLCMLAGRPTMAASRHHQLVFLVVGQLNVAALFSLYPLAVKDDLREAYWALSVALLAVYYALLPKVVSPSLWRLSVVSLCGMAVIHVVSTTVTPPPRYPDVITMAFIVYSFLHFFLAFVALNVMQWLYLQKDIKED